MSQIGWDLFFLTFYLAEDNLIDCSKLLWLFFSSVYTTPVLLPWIGYGVCLMHSSFDDYPYPAYVWVCPLILTRNVPICFFVPLILHLISFASWFNSIWWVVAICGCWYDLFFFLTSSLIFNVLLCCLCSDSADSFGVSYVVAVVL